MIYIKNLINLFFVTEQEKTVVFEIIHSKIKARRELELFNLIL